MHTSLRVVTAPAKEAVSLEDARRHLRVDPSDDDGLIQALITTSRRLPGRSLIAQTLLWTMSHQRCDTRSGSPSRRSQRVDRKLHPLGKHAPHRHI